MIVIEEPAGALVDTLAGLGYRLALIVQTGGLDDGEMDKLERVLADG
jgi:hypothetical protein